MLGCREVTLADEAAVAAATGVAPGYLGPIGLKLRIVADLAVHGMRGAVTGANEANAHYIEVDQERDFTPTAFADLRLAVAGDPCPRCESGSSWKPIAASKWARYFISAQSTARRWARPISTPKGASSPSRWAAMASASAAWSPPRSSKITTPTASSGRCRLRRFRCSLLPINYKEQTTARRGRQAVSGIAAARRRSAARRPRRAAGSQIQRRRSDRHSFARHHRRQRIGKRLCRVALAARRQDR